MKEALYLGVDGGQSGTRFLVVNGAGEIVGCSESAKVDFVLASGGKEKLKAILEDGLKQIVAGKSFRAAFLGLSGVSKGGSIEKAVRSVCASVFFSESLDVDADAMIAWAGALELQPGIIAIAGSGSVALGVDAMGQTARAGGWGCLFGDEAGAFGIARDCLKMVLASIDQNRPIDSLVQLYTDLFGGTSPEQLVKQFYAGQVSRAELAAVTPAIAKLASQGDLHARQVFSEAATQLAEQVVAVSHKLSWPGPEVKWSPVGGVFKAGELILRPMGEYLAASGKRFELVPPKFPPVVGAVLLAMQQVGDLEPTLSEKIAAQLVG